MRVELDHPIANDLKRHAADLGRLRPGGPVINRRERQKPPRLRSVLALRPRTNRNSIKIRPERDSHGEPLSFATFNQNQADSGIPNRSDPFRDLVLRAVSYPWALTQKPCSAGRCGRGVVSVSTLPSDTTRKVISPSDELKVFPHDRLGEVFAVSESHGPCQAEGGRGRNRLQQNSSIARTEEWIGKHPAGALKIAARHVREFYFPSRWMFYGADRRVAAFKQAVMWTE